MKPTSIYYLKNDFFAKQHKVKILSETETSAETSMEVQAEAKNPYGIVKGGVLYSLADDTAGLAAHGDGRFYVTQSGTLHFVRNSPDNQTLYAKAKVLHRGKTVSLVNVCITTSDEQLIAEGDFVFHCIEVSEEFLKSKLNALS